MYRHPLQPSLYSFSPHRPLFRIRSLGTSPRQNASKAALPMGMGVDADDSCAVADSPRRRPFAVERVDGREHHISWSAKHGIIAEWREASVNAGSTHGRDITSTRSSIFGGLTSWFRQMFLPTNYPQSVHRSYTPYHILQFFETTLGTLVSVLCNQALLTSVGVSAEGSIFGAVAVQWIIKDGAGEIAKLFFIRKFSPYFDSHPKAFDLFGEGIMALGSGLQIATLLVSPSPANFLICAAGGNIFKLIGGAIWFTTHIKFVRYFSAQGNTGDVAAKAESQASIAQLTGYAAGVGLLAISHSASYLYSIFFLSLPIHLVVTAWMLRVAAFELLTLPRLSWLAGAYVREEGDDGSRGIVPLNELEAANRTGLFGEFYKKKDDRYVTLAPSVNNVLASKSYEDRARWEVCASVFNDEKYLLYPPPLSSSSLSTLDQPISIFYHPSATLDDMLRSVLNASYLRHALTSSHLDGENSIVLRATLDRTKRNFHDFKARLVQNGWNTDEIAFADHGRRVLWGSAARHNS